MIVGRAYEGRKKFDSFFLFMLQIYILGAYYKIRSND